MAAVTRSPSIPPEVWRLAYVIVFGAFMAGLDTSLMTVGLATIAHDLHGSLTSAQWVSSGYLVALAAVLPVCGWLGRRIGAGRLWLIALAAFTVLSGLCALAPSLPALIVARVLQGAAGGLLVPAGQTVLGRAAGPGRMGRVMNTAGIAVVLAPAIGPTIGGLLIENLSWHWLFLVNVPVGSSRSSSAPALCPGAAASRPGRSMYAGSSCSLPGCRSSPTGSSPPPSNAP